MTRRTSTRALAREIYRESIMQETPTPDPSPHPPSPCGLRRTSGGGETTELTERVRALYEGSAVPVREIARLAGVTERTIYKYAAKHAWKPRYRWTPDGARRALEQLRRHRDEQAKHPPAQRTPADHLLCRALQMSVEVAIDDWEARGRAWHEAQNRTGAA
jgi:AcrR family transcriptional regulator